MTRLLSILIIVAGISFGSCKKTEDPVPVDATESLEFTSLSAESTDLEIGTGTVITATAKGAGLVYTWSVPVGILSGSGAQIEYFGCCVGTYDVICTIKDSGNNSAEKKISITVE